MDIRDITVTVLILSNWLVFADYIQENYKYSNKEETIFDSVSHLNNLQHVRNASLGLPDIRAGILLDNWDPNSGILAEELGPYFEGDILNIENTPGRSGIIGDNYRWPNRILYYKIGETFTEADRKRILQAIDMFHQQTCIKFELAGADEKDYVSIENTRVGCFSDVGKTGGAQILNLQSPGCLIKIGTLIHEFLHALGFYHEQSRRDRNRYVKIIYKNIIPGKERNFKLRKNSHAFNLPYDYPSVMHYSEKAFSKNNKPTIVAKCCRGTLGNRDNFTPLDIEKLHAMYNCN